MARDGRRAPGDAWTPRSLAPPWALRLHLTWPSTTLPPSLPPSAPARGASSHPRAHPHQRLMRAHERLRLPLVDSPRHAAQRELRRASKLRVRVRGRVGWGGEGEGGVGGLRECVGARARAACPRASARACAQNNYCPIAAWPPCLTYSAGAPAGCNTPPPHPPSAPHHPPAPPHPPPLQAPPAGCSRPGSPGRPASPRTSAPPPGMHPSPAAAAPPRRRLARGVFVCGCGRGGEAGRCAGPGGPPSTVPQPMWPHAGHGPLPPPAAQIHTFTYTCPKHT